jgi:pimeloyl-ACP methyl ester carboxylesterase
MIDGAHAPITGSSAGLPQTGAKGEKRQPQPFSRSGGGDLKSLGHLPRVFFWTGAGRTIGAVSGLFVPGWGAPPGLYEAGLPAGWEALEPPGYAATHGRVDAYRRWLDCELDRRGEPTPLAGHSMGAALAILVAADRPDAVERLVLLSPAGLPLAKSLPAILATFTGQVAHRRYSASHVAGSVGRVLRAPRAALRLARAVHDLDLRPQLERVRAASVPATVVGCLSDRLTTPDHCRRLAGLLGAEYREVEAPGGHIWMIADRTLLASELAELDARGPRGVHTVL